MPQPLFQPASRLFRLCLALLCAALTPLARAAIDFGWPTPAPALTDGHSVHEFFQATASGEQDSGGFGCVRNGGHRFHEGLDIRAMQHDRHGEPTDDIFAAMDGVVRHINNLSGESNYGRYIVIEHPDQTPCVYTLYAHLSHVAPGLRIGDRVKRGQVIATMGHSTGGSAIPRDRAHLHFEIGVYATRDFQSWYSFRKFGSPNMHGAYNGMNLIGLDPADFVSQWRSGRVDSFAAYLLRSQAAVKVRIATTRTPDFVQRYPSLVTGEAPSGLLGGWEVSIDKSGLPFRWTPLTPNQVVGLRPNQVMIVDTDEELLRHNHCKALVSSRRGSQKPGKDLEALLQLLFGLR